MEETTEALQKLSVSDNFTLSSKESAPLTKNDQITVELLHLLDQYEALTNDSYRTVFIEAFSMLSRANYYGSKRYGIDSFDLRPYQACTTVKNSQLVRHPIERKKVEKVEKKTDQGENSKKDEKKGEKSEKDGEPEKYDAQASGVGRATTVRNRKEKETKTEEVELPKLKDPLLQFGTFVPSQLRQAQTLFSEALDKSLQVLQLQKKISELVTALESEKEEDGTEKTEEKEKEKGEENSTENQS